VPPRAKRPPKPTLTVEVRHISELVPDPNNANVHPEQNVREIRASLRRFGLRKPLVIDKDNIVVAGNGTLEALAAEGYEHVDVTVFPGTATEARAYAIADNKTGQSSYWDNDQLLATLQGLSADTELLIATGFTPGDLEQLMGAGGAGPSAGGSAASAAARDALAQRFGVPPFTVLDARSGRWRDRKRLWLELGIESELGRDPKLLGGGLARQGEGGMVDQLTKPKRARTGASGNLEYETTTGATSIFDPVLTELVVRWYSAAGDHVIDPWAGGSVRGLVASLLGRHYTGIELRPEQVAANRAQGSIGNRKHKPTWVEGESAEQLAKLPAEGFDLILGCPPYYNLEQYSDDPRDLSNLTAAAFDKAMAANVRAAAERLRQDAFAVFVVGNVREPSGRLLDLRGLMVRCCEAAGLRFYNDAMLITPIGSLPVRAGKAFAASRVLGRAHQEVLVFVKGDRKRATERIGTVDLEAELAAAAATGEWDDA
jgi:hypothetical protein